MALPSKESTIPMMLTKKYLQKLYVEEQKSMKEIAEKLGCSVNRIHYWMIKHRFPRRSLRDAIYRKHHPQGDPFKYVPPRTAKDKMLFGMGMGLYWGEGTKANKHAVRLGNTDPELLKMFQKFLMRFFQIPREDFRFGLQLFTDINPKKALDFWTKELKIDKRQFYKITVTPSGSLGTYRKKSPYGVVTLYYNNYKVRDHLIKFLDTLSGRRSSGVEQHNGNV